MKKQVYLLTALVCCGAVITPVHASLTGWEGHDEETEKIVEEHRYDFDCYNAAEYLEEHGGYTEYVRSLGGVFAEYADFEGTVNSREQFHDIAEYVWGLYDIWGVDYSNGLEKADYESWSEFQYKAFDDQKGAFYPDIKSMTGRRWVNYSDPEIAGNDALTIDAMLSDPENNFAVVNCSQGVAQLLKKAGLIDDSWSDPGYYPSRYKNEYGWNYTLIKDAADLMPGDILIYVNSAGASFKDRDTVTEIGNYYSGIQHTNIVIDRNEETGRLTFYDSGKGYTYYGECRYTRAIGEWPYEFAADWLGLRFDNIHNALIPLYERYDLKSSKGVRELGSDILKQETAAFSSLLDACSQILSHKEQ